MRYAFYGDDFTGATDTLATLAQAGARTLLFLGVPDDARLAAAGPLDALGIAGVARSLDPVALGAELAPVARFLGALRAPVLHYKICSTFDSAPHAGSIGVALGQLRPAAPNALRAIVGGQPSLGRYCAFGQLFATAGDSAIVHRIDRHPTMSRHPVTPMAEADLRRHLAAQGLAGIALVDLRQQDDARFDAAVEEALGADPAAVLFDVTHDDHLHRIGRLLWRRAGQAPLLAIGPSSVAQALAFAWNETSPAGAAPSVQGPGPADGPVFVLAGSQSPVSRRQVDAAAGYRRVEVDATRLVRDGVVLDTTAAQCAALLDAGAAVLAHTAPAGAEGPAPLEVAVASARLLARVLAHCPRVRRVGIAGGDTSSHAVRGLGIWGLEYAGALSAGVSIVRARADQPRLQGLELMLKGGQMGPSDVFDRLLRG
jgi:uncharacterized protein YgbK (DUF1537 family)